MKKIFIISLCFCFLCGCGNNKKIDQPIDDTKYNPSKWECVINDELSAMWSRDIISGSTGGAQQGCTCQQIADFDLKHKGYVDTQRMENSFFCKSSDYSIKKPTSHNISNQGIQAKKDEGTIYSDAYLYSSESKNSKIITDIPVGTEVYFDYNNSDKDFIFVELIGTGEKGFIHSSVDLRLGTEYRGGINTIDQIVIEPKTFYGYDCTKDCSGHQAGYDWAEEKGIDDIDDCGGNSQSFIEGCWAYVKNNY